MITEAEVSEGGRTPGRGRAGGDPPASPDVLASPSPPGTRNVSLESSEGGDSQGLAPDPRRALRSAVKPWALRLIAPLPPPSVLCALRSRDCVGRKLTPRAR